MDLGVEFEAKPVVREKNLLPPRNGTSDVSN
jgi:hypothetical protein